MSYEIRAATPPWTDGVDILIMERLFLRQPGEARRVVTALTVSDKQQGDFLEPTLRLDHDMAQQLLDNLWACGLRPTDAKSNPGALSATERHLEDMRRLVFEKP